MTLTISISGKTDKGLKRLKNEDTFLIRPERGFCLVADGMGGEAAGEVASQLFAETAEDVFSGVTRRTENEITSLVKMTFSQANERILEHVKKNPLHRGMGCTAELIAFSDIYFIIGHIGDSRTYCYRNGQLKRLTHDHSLVQKQIDEGLITPEEAKGSIYRNIVLRAAGIDETISVDIIKGKMASGDIFLSCSDGLTDMADESLIRDVLTSPGNMETKTETLIELANSAGGQDNITVVLAQIL